eukprot:TRINITY_DN21572_c0_g1_i3.p1 TRINITY_DN21572_c0_g1~~TRINITY_DN21572_c0_g1_i3.p1  ORF type:complete len:153 (+),score=0.33 TRINITY_DN21572_c0_g1_i3:524-982(+)
MDSVLVLLQQTFTKREKYNSVFQYLEIFPSNKNVNLHFNINLKLYFQKIIMSQDFFWRHYTIRKKKKSGLDTPYWWQLHVVVETSLKNNKVLIVKFAKTCCHFSLQIFFQLYVPIVHKRHWPFKKFQKIQTSGTQADKQEDSVTKTMPNSDK